MSVATPWGHGEVETALVGDFNAANLLGVLASFWRATCHRTPRSPPWQASPRRRTHAAPGRGTAPLVVVDYAHSPDALDKVLSALKPAVAEGAASCACSAAEATATRASGRRWAASPRGAPRAWW